MLLHSDGRVELTLPEVPLATNTVVCGGTDPQSLTTDVLRQPIIEIQFASAADGRGYSVARHLRVTLRYAGTLTASGSMLPDQLAYLYKAGFDQVVVDETLLLKHSAEDWLAAHKRCCHDRPYGTQSYSEAAVSGRASVWQQRVSG